MEAGDFYKNPNILLDVLFDKGLLYLVIKNHSNVEAYDIQVNFDKDFSGIKGTQQVSGFTIFKKLAYLPPMKEIKIFWDVAISYFSRNEPTEVEVFIKWFDYTRENNFTKHIFHDISIYKELGYIAKIE